MDLRESFLLAIADKLLIGAVLLIAGYWLNGRIEKLKGALALQNAVALSRGLAYGVLWNKTEQLTPRGGSVPSEQDCAAGFNGLRKWYYSESGAMQLSFDATSAFLSLLAALERRDCAESKKLASGLRTQMKVDLGSYTTRQARKPLPIAG